MPLDHYVTLGHSGLRVSPFCLGTMGFGEDLGWGSSVADSQAILDRYLERGGNFIDTANLYTKGHSEVILGDHLKARRDRIVLATKFCANMHPGDPNSGGAGRKAIIDACEQSLRRLRTDYIDLYWMHQWDAHTPIDETMLALEALVHAGKVRYLGASDTPAWKVAQAQTAAQIRGRAPFIALQLEYSLLERTVEGEQLPMARELGLGVMPWSPLKNGVLSGTYTRANAGTVRAARGGFVEASLTESAYAIVDQLAAIATALGTTPARVALAWVRSRAGVASTIIGARSIAQLDDNLGALDVTLAPEHTRALDELTTPQLDFPAPYIPFTGMIQAGGTTINGETFAISPVSPKPGDRAY